VSTSHVTFCPGKFI